MSFGFYEFHDDSIYSSNIFINKFGEVSDIFRRVSKTWTVKDASCEYKTGNEFHKFDFMGVKIVVEICGDLWFEDNIKKINELAPDIILWPLYIDYSLNEWRDVAEVEYKHQAAKLKAPTLMVNSYMNDSIGAIGGAYHFSKGEIKSSVPLGRVGELTIEIN